MGAEGVYVYPVLVKTGKEISFQVGDNGTQPWVMEKGQKRSQRGRRCTDTRLSNWDLMRVEVGEWQGGR